MPSYTLQKCSAIMQEPILTAAAVVTKGGAFGGPSDCLWEEKYSYAPGIESKAAVAQLVHGH